MTSPLTLTCNVHFNLKAKGRKQLRPGQAPKGVGRPGRVPRIAKLMALAIRFEGLLRGGVVRDYAELARLGHVTRARITQIMNLLLLAPDIQEHLLFLPGTERGRDPIQLHQLQPIAAVFDWKRQRSAWGNLLTSWPKHTHASAASPSAELPRPLGVGCRARTPGTADADTAAVV